MTRGRCGRILAAMLADGGRCTRPWRCRRTPAVSPVRSPDPGNSRDLACTTRPPPPAVAVMVDGAVVRCTLEVRLRAADQSLDNSDPTALSSTFAHVQPVSQHKVSPSYNIGANSGRSTPTSFTYSRSAPGGHGHQGQPIVVRGLLLAQEAVEVREVALVNCAQANQREEYSAYSGDDG